MPIIPPSQACGMPNSQSSLFGTPAFAAEIAHRRAYALAVSNAVDNAQTAYNAGLVESPWDWRKGSINLMKDIARTNAQRYAPGGIFPPFGNVLPSFVPRQYPPGVLTPAKRGVAAGPVAGPQPTAGVSPGTVPSAGRSSHYGPVGGRGGRAGRDVLPVTSAPDSQPASASPTRGTGAGSGLIGAPFTRPIPREGAPMATVQPAGAGTNATHIGPNGAIGFTGRKVECSVAAVGVDIVGPQTGTPPTPAPQVTIEPQLVDPPILPLADAPGGVDAARRFGLSGAYPMSLACQPSGGIPQTEANEQNRAAAESGISPWWWILLAGLGIWAMSGSDEKQVQPRTRRRVA